MESLNQLKERRRELGRLIRELDRASGKSAVDVQRELSAKYAAEKRAASSELDSIPAIVDQKRRDSCRDDLRLFFETYFPHVFVLDWSDHHLKLIEMIQRAILEGLQQAIGFPRGSGKTTICQYALVWSMLYGHCHFGILVAAEKSKAAEQMSSLISELTQNELLLADFPEVMVPLRASDGIALKARNQRLNGRLTRLEVSSTHVITPKIPQTQSHGNDERIIKIATITGAARGALIRNKRPDFLLIDDPSTRRSAKSPPMNAERAEIISGDLLAMAGPGKSISALMTCTVIYANDLADNFLDRNSHPEWHGIRVKMLESFPKATSLWDQWADIVRECQQNELPLTNAHDFYRENQAKMDEGAVVYWPARIIRRTENTNDDFVSAIESAMFLHYRDPAAFASEYQNEPIEGESDDDMPPVAVIRKQTGHCKRHQVPSWADTLTAFVDIQKRILVYSVVAWQKDSFTGHVIDYGSWPDQKRRYYTREDARSTMGHQKRGSPWSSCLRHALENLILGELGRTYIREDGIDLRVERGLVDANWGDSADIVYTFFKEYKLAPTWMPSHGMGVKATQKALNDTKFSRAARVKKGVHWRINKHEQYNIERVVFDTNWWKSFHCQRWNTATGDPGCITLYSGRDHEMFADHMNAEFGIAVEAKERKVTQWQTKPGNPDNDLLDCMVGNCVAASMLGAMVKNIEAFVPRQSTGSKPAITTSNVAAFYG